VCAEGAILCGEAASALDPASGQGILTSLMTGMKAAQTAALCMDSKTDENILLAAYDEWCLMQFESKAHRLADYYAEKGIEIQVAHRKRIH
jgi:flavin-dependent dehydrogenase